MNSQVYSLTINGFPVEAGYTAETMEETIDPFLGRLRTLQQTLRRRIIVFLAAPPGAGKSTLAKMLETEAGDVLQCLSIDGFHYPNAHLAEMKVMTADGEATGAAIKGAPETYDVQKLKEHLIRLKEEACVDFPLYDRRLHEPVDDAVRIEKPIVLLEGNWLLYPKCGWEELKSCADLTVYLDAEAEDLKEGLIQRKERGGKSREEAEAWFASTDGPNILRVKEERMEADMILARVGHDAGSIRIIKDLET